MPKEFPENKQWADPESSGLSTRLEIILVVTVVVLFVVAMLLIA